MDGKREKGTAEGGPTKQNYVEETRVKIWRQQSFNCARSFCHLAGEWRDIKIRRTVMTGEKVPCLLPVSNKQNYNETIL